MTTISIVTFLLCSAFLRAAAIQQDREPGTLRRLAEIIGLSGALLCLPAALISFFGNPSDVSSRWLDAAMGLCSTGLSVLFVGVIAWMVINAVYASIQRRQVIAIPRPRSAD